MSGLHHFVSKDLSADYATILKNVMAYGEEVAPRGLLTMELLSFTLELTDPTKALPRGTNRKIHMGLAAAEALQLVGGFSDPAAMLQISKHFNAFTDGGVFHAPYGPRIATQIPAAIDWLRHDVGTRKAYIAVWDPVQDLWCHDTRDHPCTTSLQFMIRRGCLDLHVNMRANDAWRGFPYDVFQFTQLQLAVAGLLGIPVGTYFHHATSFHLYSTNYGDVEALEVSSQGPVDGVYSRPFMSDWADVQARARALFYGSTTPDTGGEEILFNAMRKAGIEGGW